MIVMRHDLKMRRGKQISQGAHASMSFICRRFQEAGSVSLDDFTDTQRFGDGAVKFVNSELGKKLHLRGIYARVVTTGVVRVGDAVRKL